MYHVLKAVYCLGRSRGYHTVKGAVLPSLRPIALLAHLRAQLGALQLDSQSLASVPARLLAPGGVIPPLAPGLEVVYPDRVKRRVMPPRLYCA